MSRPAQGFDGPYAFALQTRSIASFTATLRLAITHALRVRSDRLGTNESAVQRSGQSTAVVDQARCR